MDLLEKTTRAPNRLSLRAVGRAIVDHMIATAHQRAIAGLNDFQLSRMGVGRNLGREAVRGWHLAAPSP